MKSNGDPIMANLDKAIAATEPTPAGRTGLTWDDVREISQVEILRNDKESLQRELGKVEARADSWKWVCILSWLIFFLVLTGLWLSTTYPK